MCNCSSWCEDRIWVVYFKSLLFMLSTNQSIICSNLDLKVDFYGPPTVCLNLSLQLFISSFTAPSFYVIKPHYALSSHPSFPFSHPFQNHLHHHHISKAFILLFAPSVSVHVSDPNRFKWSFSWLWSWCCFSEVLSSPRKLYTLVQFWLQSWNQSNMVWLVKTVKATTHCF